MALQFSVYRIMVSGVGYQASEKREPQNAEQGIMNVEGKENFSIRHSLFDIRYSKQGKSIGP